MNPPTVSAAVDPAPVAGDTPPTDAVPGGAPPRTERRQRREGTNRAFRAIKARHAAELTLVERIANRLTVAAGSTTFLVCHVVWFVAWVGWNVFARDRAFDPFPFGLLTMTVSLEAIFLSLFVLMSQNRESAIAEVREEVTLAVNLRVEEEVTKVLQLVSGLYARLGQQVANDSELALMLQPLDADAIEQELSEQIHDAIAGARKRSRLGMFGRRKLR